MTAEHTHCESLCRRFSLVPFQFRLQRCDLGLYTAATMACCFGGHEAKQQIWRIVNFGIFTENKHILPPSPFDCMCCLTVSEEFSFEKQVDMLQFFKNAPIPSPIWSKDLHRKGCPTAHNHQLFDCNRVVDIYNDRSRLKTYCRKISHFFCLCGCTACLKQSSGESRMSMTPLWCFVLL